MKLNSVVIVVDDLEFPRSKMARQTALAVLINIISVDRDWKRNVDDCRFNLFIKVEMGIVWYILV